MQTADRLSKISIRRFQSLWEADVSLGELTVVVGASNSGKSAFGRAIRALARNTTGNAHVSVGASAATVTAEREDGALITLERGKSTSTYKISYPDEGREEVYTKSGTNVPRDVVDVLRTPAPDSGEPDPHFTTQHDGPFLLNVTGTIASKVLGDLTNVSMLQEAAREANRRRTEASRQAAFHKTEALEQARRVKTEYVDLPARREAAAHARRLIERARESLVHSTRLRELADRATTAALAADRARTSVEKSRASLDGVTEALDAAEIRAKHLGTLRALADRATKAGRAAEQQRELAVNEEKRAEQCEARVTELLAEAEVCPVCRQRVSP